MSETVSSPCISVCALDEHDVCIGCFRSGQEISQWGKMSLAEKQATLKKVAERENERFHPAIPQQ